MPPQNIPPVVAKDNSLRTRIIVRIITILVSMQFAGAIFVGFITGYSTGEPFISPFLKIGTFIIAIISLILLGVSLFSKKLYWLLLAVFGSIIAVLIVYTFVITLFVLI